MKSDVSSRLKKAMLERGVGTGAELARLTRIPESTIRAYLGGTRKPPLDVCRVLGRGLGVDADWLFEGTTDMFPPKNISGSVTEPLTRELPYIPILGRVAAGAWLEVEAGGLEMHELPASAFPPDPRYPLKSQYDLVVHGTSINKFARSGEVLRCVDLYESGASVGDGDMVIVERTRGDLRETTAKRVRRNADTFELWPESDDPRYQTPIVVPVGGQHGDDTTRIVAKVLYKYQAP